MSEALLPRSGLVQLALERFDDAQRRRKNLKVADGVVLELMVTGRRTCEAASRGFVQRGGWPARSPRGESVIERGLLIVPTPPVSAMGSAWLRRSRRLRGALVAWRYSKGPTSGPAKEDVLSWVMKARATPGPAWQRGRGGDHDRRDGRVAAGRGGDINEGGEGVKGRPGAGSKFTF